MKHTTETWCIILTIFVSKAGVQKERLFGVYDVRWLFLAQVHVVPLKRFVLSSVCMTPRSTTRMVWVRLFGFITYVDRFSPRFTLSRCSVSYFLVFAWHPAPPHAWCECGYLVWKMAAILSRPQCVNDTWICCEGSAFHYNDVTMGAIASQITSLTIVFSTVYLDTDQRKHQSSASLAFVRGIHRRPVNSPHKRPLTRKMFPFDDIIMLPGTLVTVSATGLSLGKTAR